MAVFGANNFKIAGLAGASYFLSKVRPEWGKQVLFEGLKTMPGLPAKFSQWIEQRWDLQGESSRPLLSLPQVQHILSQSSPNFYSLVDSISEVIASASVGQVHRVQLKTGEDLAVKIQYPGLASEVVSQIDQVIWLMEKSPARHYGFNGEVWRQEFQSMFVQELNYENELAQQNQFFEFSKNYPSVLVPKVYPQWSTSSILVQEYLPGVSLKQMKEQKQSHQRELVASSLARALVHSLIHGPILHGDLQPQNWAWSETHQKVILYDFGSCIEWNTIKQELFCSLIANLKSTRDHSPYDYLVALGFDAQKLIPLRTQLPVLIETLLEPFWNTKLSRLSHWKLSETFDAVLGDQAWYFRTAGPPWFLWLLRSMGSVFCALQELDDRVPVAEIFTEEFAQKPSVTHPFLTMSSPQSLTEPPLKFSEKAQFLRIHVKEGSDDIAVMKFPIHVVNDLESLMSPEILEKIRAQNLDLSLVKSKALGSGLIKQDLFNFKSQTKSLRVWIE